VDFRIHFWPDINNYPPNMTSMSASSSDHLAAVNHTLAT